MQSRDELTPLSILLRSMREKWAEGDVKEATRLAGIAAPYVHPRRGIAPAGDDTHVELRRLSDAELDRRLKIARTRSSEAEADPKQSG